MVEKPLKSEDPVCPFRIQYFIIWVTAFSKNLINFYEINEKLNVLPHKPNTIRFTLETRTYLF